MAIDLREHYLNLINHQLSATAAKADRRYPVRFNHCFARIIFDNLCGQWWCEVITKPACKPSYHELRLRETAA